MGTNYPAAYDSPASGSLNNSKANEDPVVDVTYDVDATEWNTHADALLAVERKLGDGSTTLTSDGDADEYNVREILSFMSLRADRSSYYDHFLFNNYTTALTEDVGAAAAYAQVSGGIGVAQIATVAGAARGFSQTYNHFHSRSTYFRCRWQVDGLGDANGDMYECGLYRDATHYVKFHSTRAGGVWPDWTIEINDGGATDSAVLAGIAPDASTWHVFEIVTSPGGATFYIDRAGTGAATEYTDTLTGQAPENGYCSPILQVTLVGGSSGGDNLNIDLMSAGSTQLPL